MVIEEWTSEVRSGVDVSVMDSRFFVWRERGGEKRDVDMFVDVAPIKPSLFLNFFN